MIDLWVNADHFLCVRPSDGSQRLDAYFDTLYMLDKLDRNTYGTSLKNAKILKYILQKDLPEENINESSVVNFLTSVYKNPKERPLDSNFDVAFSQLDLYDFQKFGVQYLSQMKRALLGDDVGLGKTGQALIATEFIRRTDPELTKVSQSVLIVCPAQLKKKWAQEVTKFLGIEPLIIDADNADPSAASAQRGRLPLYKAACPYKIINYELLVRDPSYANKYLRPIGILIVDEIQYCKSHKSRRHSSIYHHSLHSKYFFGLSATPIEKGPIEIFNLFKMIDTELLGDREKFKARYIVPDYWGNMKSVKNTDELQLQVGPYILRRHKDEVSDELPKVIENNYYIDLTKEQRKIYKAYKTKTIEALKNINFGSNDSYVLSGHKKHFDLDEDFDDKDDLDPLALTHMLRRVCLSTQLLDIEGIPPSGQSAKLNALLDIIESLGDSKAVIFCFYTRMVDLISEFLTKNKIVNLAIHGKMKTKAADVARTFTKESPYKVLVTSDILKEGHDLLAANYVINFDMPFSSTTYTQRCGRIDRIGQEKSSVFFVNLIADNTLELDVYDTIKKRLLFSKSMFSPDFLSTRITVQDIKGFLTKDAKV